MTSTGIVMPSKVTRTAFGTRVLVAEDHPNCRWVLGALLRRAGYDCRTAGDGAEALSLVRSFAPQVILMDLMMPGIDGLEATRRLKADSRTRSIPVFAVSADVSDAARIAAREAGCETLLSKPIAMEELFEWIAGLRNDRDASDVP